MKRFINKTTLFCYKFNIKLTAIAIASDFVCEIDMCTLFFLELMMTNGLPFLSQDTSMSANLSGKSTHFITASLAENMPAKWGYMSE